MSEIVIFEDESQWATRVLREHLTQGCSLNEHRLARRVHVVVSNPTGVLEHKKARHMARALVLGSPGWMDSACGLTPAGRLRCAAASCGAARLVEPPF